MAPLAIRPEYPGMHRIFFMTAVAALGELNLAFDRFPVAGAAFQPFVRAVQGKTAVLKTPEAPAVRVMTGAAFVAQTPLVFILGFMTAGAADRSTGVSRLQVAFFT